MWARKCCLLVLEAYENPTRRYFALIRHLPSTHRRRTCHRLIRLIHTPIEMLLYHRNKRLMPSNSAGAPLITAKRSSEPCQHKSSYKNVTPPRALRVRSATELSFGCAQQVRCERELMHGEPRASSSPSPRVFYVRALVCANGIAAFSPEQRTFRPPVQNVGRCRHCLLSWAIFARGNHHFGS